ILGIYPARHSGVVSHLERYLIDSRIPEGIGAFGEAVLCAGRLGDCRARCEVVELPNCRVPASGSIPERTGEAYGGTYLECRATRGRSDVMPDVHLGGLGGRVTSTVSTGYRDGVDAALTA